MVRTQIQLTEEQARRLREQASRLGISLAEALRRCVDRALQTAAPERPELWRRARATYGSLRDEATDLATHHDRYLEDAFRE